MSDQIIGIVTHGSAGQVRLDGATGSVYAFTAGVGDQQPAEEQTKRRGVLTGLVIRSQDGHPRAKDLRNRLNGHAQRTPVSVLPQSLPGAAVTPDTWSAADSYCMGAALMQLQ
jgi:hypothetical protein